MGFFSSSPKYTNIWAWEGPPETSEEAREKRAKSLMSKYNLNRRDIEYFSHIHAMHQYEKMRELRINTPLPEYDDVVTLAAAWGVVNNGGSVVWHEKGDKDSDWPKHNFMKFTKL